MVRRGRIALLVLLTCLLAACSRGGQPDATPLAAAGEGPSVLILAPASGSRIPAGQEVEILSRATDPAGVARVELTIGTDLIALDPAPVEQPTFDVTQRWVPVEPGEYQAQVIAYNVQGQASQPATITLIVEGAGLAPVVPTPTSGESAPPAAEATATVVETLPPAATASVTGIAGTVTTAAGVNVRAGPDLGAERVGGVWLNNQVTGIARNAAGDWIKVRFGESGEQVGWLYAPLVTWQGDTSTLPPE